MPLLLCGLHVVLHGHRLQIYWALCGGVVGEDAAWLKRRPAAKATAVRVSVHWLLAEFGSTTLVAAWLAGVGISHIETCCWSISCQSKSKDEMAD